MSDASKPSPAPNQAGPASDAEPQVFQAATAMFQVPAAEVSADRTDPAAEAASSMLPPVVDPERVWHVVVGAAQQGPMTLTEMKMRLERGDIDTKTLVWRAGMQSWSPLDEVSVPMDDPAGAAVAAQPQPVSPEMQPDMALSAAAARALDTLIAAEAQAPAAVTPGPSAHVGPGASPLTSADLFGNNETQFLQAPGMPAAPAQAGVAPVAVAAASPAVPAPAAAPRTRVPVWAAAGAVGLLAAGGGYLLWGTRAAAPAPQIPPAAAAAPAVATPPAAAEPAAQAAEAARPMPIKATAPEPELIIEAPATDEPPPPAPKRAARRHHGRHGHARHRHNG